MKNPYWLIREPGKTVGCGTVEFDTALNSEQAIAEFRDTYEAKILIPADFPLEAVLVTLTYTDDGQPVVTEVV